MIIVDEHPGWENEPFDSDFAGAYGTFQPLADVFRQIGHDDRFTKRNASAR